MAKPTTRTAVEGIEEYIRDNKLTIGDALPSEIVLSKALDCSRSSIREAMRTLQSLDVVEVRHGQGTYLSSMSLSPLVHGMVLRMTLDVTNAPARLIDVVETRQAIETSVAEELVRAHTRTSLAELLELVGTMRDSFEEHQSFASEDRFFHQLLLAPINNGLMRELNDALWQIHDKVIPILEIDVSEDLERTLESHTNVVRALQDKDPAAFRQAIIDHYHPLRQAVAALVNKE